MTAENSAHLSSLKLQQISAAETPFYIRNLVHHIATFLRVLSWGFAGFFFFNPIHKLILEETDVSSLIVNLLSMGFN